MHRTFFLPRRTHAIGQMPLDVQLSGPDGELLNEVKR